MTDQQALDRIWEILNLEDPDYQWSPDELDQIADVMLQWKTCEDTPLAAMRAFARIQQRR